MISIMGLNPAEIVKKLHYAGIVLPFFVWKQEMKKCDLNISVKWENIDWNRFAMILQKESGDE